MLVKGSKCLQEAEAAAKKVPYKQTFRKVKLDPEQRAEVILLPCLCLVVICATPATMPEHVTLL